MKLMISGCRDGVTYGDVLIAIALSGIQYGHPEDELISLGGRGTDTFSEKWAKANRIPIRLIPCPFSKDNPYAEQAQIDKAVLQANVFILLLNGISIREDYIKTRIRATGLFGYFHQIEPSPIPFVDPVDEEPKVRKPRKIKKK